MLKLGRVTKFKILFLVLVFVFNYDVSKFSAAILEKGLLGLRPVRLSGTSYYRHITKTKQSSKCARSHKIDRRTSHESHASLFNSLCGRLSLSI